MDSLKKGQKLLSGERTERRDIKLTVAGQVIKTTIRIRPSLWSAFVKLAARSGGHNKIMRDWLEGQPADAATYLPEAIAEFIQQNSNEPTYQFKTREEWLERVIEAMRPVFAERGYALPERIRVSIGFTSKGWRGKALGECWKQELSTDGYSAIFLNPVIGDPIKMVNVLTHELCHAVDDCKSGHGKAFKECGAAMDLEGPAKHMLGDPEGAWGAWALPLIEAVGPLQHGAIGEWSPKAPKKQTTRMLKCECDTCGTLWRMSSKAIGDSLSLRCPKPECSGQFDVDLGEEGGEGGEDAAHAKYQAWRSSPPSDDADDCNGHERIYEDGVGYICRYCGEDMDDE